MIEQLASQILNDVKSTFSGANENANEAASRIRGILENKLRELNLVTREEFDAQTKVLARTREKVEALEKVVAELEEKLEKSSDS